MEDDQNGRRLKWKTTKMEDKQNGRRPKWKMNKMEDDQNVRIEKAGDTDKNGPQIWTRGKILIKRRYLDNGAILQSLGTILRGWQHQPHEKFCKYIKAGLRIKV